MPLSNLVPDLFPPPIYIAPERNDISIARAKLPFQSSGPIPHFISNKGPAVVNDNHVVYKANDANAGQKAIEKQSSWLCVLI
jgi:hypothetical protein